MSIFQGSDGKFVGLGMNDKTIGFLSRLRANEAGNVMIIGAALIIPMVALVGGAVDMSRLYATRTRLQAACDAGALAGRRTMGTDTWAANSNRANTHAEKVFALNFKAGSFASLNEDVTYTEAGGTVTGNATADVPMTLMRVFGMPTSTITLSCTSNMVIPNTDVMFVLDTTGSMAGTKITGLKRAVKCFYEALARENTDAVCETSAGETPPTGGISSAVQLRFGFMPYATNVNVGKLLPTAYFADQWNYQSRTFTPTDTTMVWGYELGTETAKSPYNYSSMPANLNDQSSYSNWQNTATGSNITINGTSYARRTNDNQSANCTDRNTIGPSGNRMLAYVDVGDEQAEVVSRDNNPPTYSASNPPTQQTINYSQSDNHTVTGWKYQWHSSASTGDKCRLSYGSRTYARSRAVTTTRQITWRQYERVNNYTYRQTPLTISSLKAGTNWNSSATIPRLTISAPITVTLSGQATPSTIYEPADLTVPWNGCIEDAYEPRNVTWSSGIPSDAYGAQIDLVPNASNSNTLWKPALPGAVWGRYTSTSYVYNGRTYYTDTKTTADVVTMHGMDRDGVDASCPSEARKLQEWTKDDYEDYVDGLTIGGNTYHDVGLVWGGRFASPDGIFAAENRTTSGGAQIYRHVIFMTDGDTVTNATNYTSQGVAWWDRRQTSQASAPSNGTLDDIVDARFSAICTAIKNKGIVLWVVSYGGSTSTTTNARLRACSSDPNTPSTRYFNADNTNELIQTFKNIANQISSLRLTS